MFAIFGRFICLPFQNPTLCNNKETYDMFFYSWVDFSVLGNRTCTLGSNRLASRHPDEMCQHSFLCRHPYGWVGEYLWPHLAFLFFSRNGRSAHYAHFCPVHAQHPENRPIRPVPPSISIPGPLHKKMPSMQMTGQIVIIYLFCIRGIFSRMTGSAPQSWSKAIVEGACHFWDGRDVPL